MLSENDLLIEFRARYYALETAIHQILDQEASQGVRFGEQGVELVGDELDEYRGQLQAVSTMLCLLLQSY